LLNIPYSRKISISLGLSAAITLLLLSTPVLLSNFLQPIQAQTPMNFRTAEPAEGSLCTGERAYLTFDVQGTTTPSSGSSPLSLTGGTFQITNSSRDGGQILYSGNIQRGELNNNTGREGIGLAYFINHISNSGRACATTGDLFFIFSSCNTSERNSITTHLSSGDAFADFTGAVECSLGDTTTTTTQQSSSSTTGTTIQQEDGDGDSDGDGILDANDNCPNLPHTRCFKEGDTGMVVHNSDR
jgi:hypothetical protein